MGCELLRESERGGGTVMEIEEGGLQGLLE